MNHYKGKGIRYQGHVRFQQDIQYYVIPFDVQLLDLDVEIYLEESLDDCEVFIVYEEIGKKKFYALK